jgi:hypothetical protein
MAPHMSWDERLAKYKYNKANGVRNGNGMNCWVSRQRKAKENGTLSDECKEKLDIVGFVWTRNHCRSYDCDAWNENFKLLEAHHGEKGNFLGPYDKLPASWVRHQRQMLKNKASLDEILRERWARLNTLGFWNATELPRKPPGNSESGLNPTVHASHTTASANSNSDNEMGQGQQHGGVVRITVSVRDSMEQSITSATRAYLSFHFACIFKPANGPDNGNQVCTLKGLLFWVSVFPVAADLSMPVVCPALTIFFLCPGQFGSSVLGCRATIGQSADQQRSYAFGTWPFLG